MSALNGQIYYENEENHGEYIYESLENLVNNYWQNFTGDNSKLGVVPRRQILFWMKKGIQQFTFDALKEVKAVELELNDNLDIILPPDYVQYVRISWLDQNTGELRPMAENRRMTLATSYLQDHEAQILFDDQGNILEGTTATELVNNSKKYTIQGDCTNDCADQKWSIDTMKNSNGNFNIDKRAGRIHFSSDNEERIIMLEYISDGLEYASESDVKVHKFSEIALYAWVTWNLLTNKAGVPDYEKRGAKKDYDTAFRNLKIKMMNLRISEVAQLLKGRNRWIR
jgi:hypothetical protein